MLVRWNEDKQNLSNARPEPKQQDNVVYKDAKI